MSLPAAGILAATITAFIGHIDSAESAQVAFDIGRWVFYFVPFVYALLHAAAACLIALIVNECPELKSDYKMSKLSLLPAVILIFTTVLTAVCAVMGAVIGSGSLFEVLLIASGAAAYAAAGAYPFLCSFLERRSVTP